MNIFQTFLLSHCKLRLRRYSSCSVELYEVFYLLNKLDYRTEVKSLSTKLVILQFFLLISPSISIKTKFILPEIYLEDDKFE